MAAQYYCNWDGLGQGNIRAAVAVLLRGGRIVAFQHFAEEIEVLGRDLVDKVTALIHEGNVQRIIVKDDRGNTFVEIPVTVAAIGVVLAPLLAAVGAIAAMVARFTIVVIRKEPGEVATPKTQA
jgi:hypothetical protein